MSRFRKSNAASHTAAYSSEHQHLTLRNARIARPVSPSASSSTVYCKYEPWLACLRDTCVAREYALSYFLRTRRYVKALTVALDYSGANCAMLQLCSSKLSLLACLSQSGYGSAAAGALNRLIQGVHTAAKGGTSSRAQLAGQPTFYTHPHVSINTQRGLPVAACARTTWQRCNPPTVAVLHHVRNKLSHSLSPAAHAGRLGTGNQQSALERQFLCVQKLVRGLVQGLAGRAHSAHMTWQ